MADVAQLVRALVCGTRCREFESHLPPHDYVCFSYNPESLLLGFLYFKSIRFECDNFF